MKISIQEKKIILALRSIDQCPNINMTRIHEMNITKFEEYFIMNLRNILMCSDKERINDDRLWSIVIGQSGKNRMTETRL